MNQTSQPSMQPVIDYEDDITLYSLIDTKILMEPLKLNHNHILKLLKEAKETANILVSGRYIIPLSTKVILDINDGYAASRKSWGKYESTLMNYLSSMNTSICLDGAKQYIIQSIKEQYFDKYPYFVPMDQAPSIYVAVNTSTFDSVDKNGCNLLWSIDGSVKIMDKCIDQQNYKIHCDFDLTIKAIVFRNAMIEIIENDIKQYGYQEVVEKIRTHEINKNSDY